MRPASAPIVSSHAMAAEDAVLSVTESQVTGPSVTEPPVTEPPVTEPPGFGDHPGRQARLSEQMGTAWSAWRRPLAVAAVGTLVLRVVTEWIGLVSQFGVDFPHRVARTPYLLTQVWGHWDAGYYFSIAQDGYAGRHVGVGQAANGIAFAPLYPWGIKLVHAVTGRGYLSSGELLSAGALFVALAALFRLAELERGAAVAGASVLVLLAWPAAFFLLAPYPESLALALGVLAFLAVRRGRWTMAGILVAAAAMTKYYLALYVVALAFAVWEARPSGTALAARWRPDAWRLFRAIGPTVGAFGAWMVYQQVHIGDALAFERAQSRQWHRNLAAPWTLLSRTISDLVHWRFLDTSKASVVELFDFVTVVLLAAVAVWVFLRVRRSYGVILALSWCVYCFQTFLIGEVREVLALFPFFMALGMWVARHPWRERILLALFLPCSYFLIERFVRGAFAG